jgi:hypothetical protein
MNDSLCRLARHRRRPRTLWASLMVLPVACAVIAGCSGGSGRTPPRAQGQPSATATASSAPATSQAPTQAAASAAASPPPCYDSCGKAEPVIFYVSTDNYNGVRPATIDLSVDTPDSNVVYDLTWSSWASGPNGQVPASATATGTGKVKTATGTVATVTITLSNPQNGDPSLWQTLTEQIAGQQKAVYQVNGMWATSASGGSIS